MRTRRLESLLSDVAPFAAPKQALEQYPTNPELAAGALHLARARGDVEDRFVVDLGVGTGMLSIAASLSGAGHVLGVDVDEDALETCRENCGAFEPALEVELVRADVMTLGRSRVEGAGTEGEVSTSTGGVVGGRRRWTCDTVLMNPPFGTRRAGADVAFLRAAFRIATGAIYSFHKSSTREHIKRVALTRFGASEAEVLAQLKYDLPATYAHHREKSVEIAVDLWRFVPGENGFLDEDGEDDDDVDTVPDLSRAFSSKARVGGGRRGRSAPRGRR